MVSSKTANRAIVAICSAFLITINQAALIGPSRNSRLLASGDKRLLSRTLFSSSMAVKSGDDSSSNLVGLERVLEKSLSEELNDYFLNLKASSNEMWVKSIESSHRALKLRYIFQSFALKALFLAYRVYRGFFVLVPALVWNVIREVRGTSSTNNNVYRVTPNWFQKRLLLRTHTYWGKKMREQVVRNYFDGVTEKNSEKIESCFAEESRIRDVCNLSGNSKLIRLVNPLDLTERCMEFLRAHPDAEVDYYYPPTCAKGESRWVFAHWFETGTWKGESCGIEAEGTPLDVEGQTRFYVNDDCKIEELVVTRTFSNWEKELFSRRSS